MFLNIIVSVSTVMFVLIAMVKASAPGKAVALVLFGRFILGEGVHSIRITQNFQYVTSAPCQWSLKEQTAIAQYAEKNKFREAMLFPEAMVCYGFACFVQAQNEWC